MAQQCQIVTLQSQVPGKVLFLATEPPEGQNGKDALNSVMKAGFRRNKQAFPNQDLFRIPAKLRHRLG